MLNHRLTLTETNHYFQKPKIHYAQIDTKSPIDLLNHSFEFSKIIFTLKCMDQWPQSMKTICEPLDSITDFSFRWGVNNERTPTDGSIIANSSTGPYVRRRSAAGANETTVNATVTPSQTVLSSASSTLSSSTTASYSPSPTLVSVTTSIPSSSPTPTATTNVTVTSSSNDDSIGGKRRSNVPPSRDEEAEAQRKHRSAQARRERRSTQSVTQDDIKAAEQQIKNRPNHTDNSSTISTSILPATNVIDASSVTLSNNKIGAPSTPSIVAEHDIETERLQRVIEEKKEKARRSSGGNEVKLVCSSTFSFCTFFLEFRSELRIDIHFDDLSICLFHVCPLSRSEHCSPWFLSTQSCLFRLVSVHLSRGHVRIEL